MEDFMSSTKARARKHLNKTEFELYTNILDPKLPERHPYHLRRKVGRLEKLRDKYATQKRTAKRDLKAKGFDAEAESNRKIKLEFLNDMLKKTKTALQKSQKIHKK